MGHYRGVRVDLVPAMRARYLAVAEAAGGGLAVLGALVPRCTSRAVASVWLVIGLAVVLLALGTWVLRRRRGVLAGSLALALAAVAVLLAVTPEPAAAVTLVIPMMLGGQMGALVLPVRHWRRLTWYVAALTASAVLVNPAGFDPPQQLAMVGLVGVGLALIGRIYAQVHDQATTDALTGAYSRAVLDRTVLGTIAAAAAGARPSLAVVDLDRLKELNDTGGHAAGDRALVDVVQVLQDGLDPDDVVARLGGDEFVVLFADQDERSAARWLERARARSTYTWSYGVTSVHGDDTVSSVLKRADDALYRHKSGETANALD